MKKVHIVTYTHWDREFRWEFERTRMRLVDLWDHLLEILDKDPTYRSFLCDGQLTLLDDYLEIRPENKEKIKKYVKEGRLEVGPWYTLPDCAPIQGESVIRNLQYGVKKCREDYGEPLKCGYNVFSFGQIGQLPQIYADFGIDAVIFYKYMDPKKARYDEFIWESPDGTRTLASHLGKEARWNWFFAAHIPLVYDKDAWDKKWRYNWGELGKVFHTANADDYGWFYDILDPENSWHPENMRMAMERALKTVTNSAAQDCVLMFDGTDFTEPHPLTPEVIRSLQKEFKGELEIVHSTLNDYLTELKAALKDKDLDVVQGPMRDGPVGSIHTDVFSTHPEVMIENSHAENTLIRYAEPLSAIAWKYGISSYPDTYLEKIWKLLFQSHAHDSMHGLGPKELGEGEMARLSQAGIIAKGLERKGLENITKEIDTSAIKDAEYFLSVHNPAAFARSEIVEAYVDIPADVILKYIILEDMDGNIVKAQEAERRVNVRAGIYHPRSRNMPFYCTKVHLYFMAENVPAGGYKTYKIKWAEKNEYPYPHEDWDAPRILAHDMLSGANQAENEFIRVSVNGNGTFNVTDKVTGKEYNSLNYFTDMGDQGNMWTYNNVPNDVILNSLSEKARVSVSTHGPLVVKFSIDLAMKLPKEYDFAKQVRSGEYSDMPIHVELTLRAGAKHLEVVTTIDNHAKDHYFKVCMPTGLHAENTWSEGSFMVAKFPVSPSMEHDESMDIRGNELARHPAQLWYDLADDKNGFAVLTDASKDYEVLEDCEDQTLAMGLVRCTRVRIACDNRLWMEYPGDESAQSLRSFTYRYAFLPHTGDWEKASLYREAIAFNAQMKVCEFGRQAGQFPTEKSFFEIEGENLVLSSVVKSDRDTIQIRLYNPTDHEIKGKLSLGFDFSTASHISLDNKVLEELKVKNGKIEFTVGHGKIYTIEIV